MKRAGWRWPPSPWPRSRCRRCCRSGTRVYVLLGLAAMVTVGRVAADGVRRPGLARAGVVLRDRRVHRRAAGRARRADPARACSPRRWSPPVAAALVGAAAAAAARARPGVRHARHAADPAVAAVGRATGPAARSGCRASPGCRWAGASSARTLVRLPGLGRRSALRPADRAQRRSTRGPGGACAPLATSEIAAAASGVPVGRYRLAVFALSAAFAGLAGGIYAFYLGYLAPGSFPVLLSIEFVVMAVVGGLGTIAGPVVGATAITLLVQALNDPRHPARHARATRRPCCRTPSTRCCWCSWCCSCREDCSRPVPTGCAVRLHVPRPERRARTRRPRDPGSRLTDRAEAYSVLGARATPASASWGA